MDVCPSKFARDCSELHSVECFEYYTAGEGGHPLVCGAAAKDMFRCGITENRCALKSGGRSVIESCALALSSQCDLFAEEIGGVKRACAIDHSGKGTPGACRAGAVLQ